MIRIHDLKIYKDIANTDVFEIAIKKAKIKKSDVIDWHISKKSIDARKKADVHYIYSIDMIIKNEEN